MILWLWVRQAWHSGLVTARGAVAILEDTVQRDSERMPHDKYETTSQFETEAAMDI